MRLLCPVGNSTFPTPVFTTVRPVSAHLSNALLSASTHKKRVSQLVKGGECRPRIYPKRLAYYGEVAKGLEPTVSSLHAPDKTVRLMSDSNGRRNFLLAVDLRHGRRRSLGCEGFQTFSPEDNKTIE